MKRKNKETLMRVALTLLTLLFTTTTAWADNPSWLRSGDSWDAVSQKLTVNSNTSMSCYEAQTEIVHLVINSGVEYLDHSSFRDCSNLQDVTFAEGATLTEIDKEAFNGCTALKSITIPASVTTIGRYAFLNCTVLTPVTFDPGSKLEVIGYGAFDYCKALTSITIPASVTSIGEYAFYECSNLANVTFATGSKLETIGEYAFSNCTALTSITIPDGVTTIGDGAFYECTTLTGITIPAGVTSINGAFRKCTALESVTFADDSKLEVIGNGAFYGCTVLTGITIPAGVTTIGNGAFYECTTLTGFTIPAGVTTIATSAFEGCTSLTSITIPASVTTIGNNAFRDCSKLATVTFAHGSALTTFGFNVFAGTAWAEATGMFYLNNIAYQYYGNATSVDIADGTVEIYAGCFDGNTTLQSVTIPASVTTIDGGAFNECTALGSVTFADGSKLKFIGDCAFYGCTALANITIPASVTSIEYGAFGYCENLATVTLNSNPRIGGEAFDKDDYGTTPAVTMNLAAKEGATGEFWTTFYNENYSFEVPATGTQIFKAALSNDAKLTLTELGDDTEEDKIITNDKAVILKSTASPIVMTLTNTNSDNNYTKGNSLHGVNDPNGLTADDPSTTSVLNKGTQGVGFYKLKAIKNELKKVAAL